MLFTQVDFIFCFLPISLVGYVLLARYTPLPNAALVWLAGASLTFYGYWKLRLLWVVLISALVSAADYFRRFNLVLSPRVADFPAIREPLADRSADRKVG